MDTLGQRFARSLAAKDTTGLRAVLADDVDFRALTPGRSWEAEGVDAVLDILLGAWLEPQDQVDGILDVSENDAVEDTAHVGYRFALTTPSGAHTMEQQAYYRGEDRISYLRVLCSGFRPVG